MKHNLRSVTLALIVSAISVASTVPSAHAQQCSLSGVAGTYGFTVTGTLLLPTGSVPVVGVGKLSLKPDGSLSGTEGRSVGGVFANETLTGAWTMNSDCTGTIKVEFFETGVLVATSVFSFVVDDNMREGRDVQQSLTLPDGTNVPVAITAVARRIFTNDEQN